MKTFTGSITQQTVDAFYLAEQQLLYPEIKKQTIKKECEQRSFTLLMLVFGYGRAISDADLKKNKMSVADYRFQWTIITRLREYVTFTEAPSASQGAGNSSITLTFDEDWLSQGMVVRIENGNGGWQNVVLTSGATSASPAGFTYTAKLVTGDASATLDVSFIVAGTKAGWSHSLDAVCDANATKTPFKTPDWYVNYMTLVKQYDIVCKDGMQSALWVQGEDGTYCYQPMEEYQKFYHFLESIEQAGWYGTRTYNDDGVCIVTNADGEFLRAGDGILVQASSGTVVDFLISDYDEPSEYEAFRQLIRTTVLDWATDNDYLLDGVELHVWAGLFAYDLWQQAMIDFLQQPGGCCFMDYETGDMVSAGIEVSRYKFSGFVLVLHKNATFSKKGVSGAFYGTSTIPLESYRFVIMPDTNCNGEPLIQCYFRGGCGVDSAYTHTIIPGTVDPRNRFGGGLYGASKYRGYEVVDESEFVFILSDPSKMIVFQPTTIAST